VSLFSDVSDLQPHPHPERFDPKHTFAFPLPALGPDLKRRDYLCSQGMCGALSHFFPQTLHAVDFRCPVGTPVLAIGAGVVTDVSQVNTVSGIHIANLYSWNSITVCMADDVYVDYVHVRPGSARVVEGDAVAVGQVLCESGETGFCPEPHLHIQVSLSDDPKALSEKFAFLATSGESFVPMAGAWYSASGRTR
jgi:murein DD-endopeptidase MepM/ murein hydrolase activator NlpD